MFNNTYHVVVRYGPADQDYVTGDRIEGAMSFGFNTHSARRITHDFSNNSEKG